MHRAGTVGRGIPCLVWVALRSSLLVFEVSGDDFGRSVGSGEVLHDRVARVAAFAVARDGDVGVVVLVVDSLELAHDFFAELPVVDRAFDDDLALVAPADGVALRAVGAAVGEAGNGALAGPVLRDGVNRAEVDCAVDGIAGFESKPHGTSETQDVVVARRDPRAIPLGAGSLLKHLRKLSLTLELPSSAYAGASLELSLLTTLCLSLGLGEKAPSSDAIVPLRCAGTMSR